MGDQRLVPNMKFHIDGSQFKEGHRLALLLVGYSHLGKRSYPGVSIEDGLRSFGPSKNRPNDKYVHQRGLLKWRLNRQVIMVICLFFV